MKTKLKSLRSFFKDLVNGKEIPGDPVDLTPGIKVSRVVDVTERKLSFNEISENILKQKEALSK
jgi:hypothetical protein